ncbi:MAG: glycosyltransferase [Rhodospirillales bacterium]
MQQSGGQFRLLIYSHDTFGLGHLRRCRAIAHALVGRRRDLSVLILTGSPIIGSFSFRSRVDFVRIPGVIKLKDGDYEPLSLNIGLDAILSMRGGIIRHTADAFQPHVFLVDKEPLGLRGEVRETLALLKARRTPVVLGLRDVLDEAGQLAEEWGRKQAVPALAEFYDAVWVYGLPQICNALEGIDLPRPVAAKVRYTGYLRREALPRQAPPVPLVPPLGGKPYLLVTTGGGGDGALLIDWVLRAYEEHPDLPHPALLVLGPFMHSSLQGNFMRRVAQLPSVQAITFEANIESLMDAAAGIVAMGGYNTFCEILSFDKPALIVPRTEPRMEQYIRASRAQALGLTRMLDIAEGSGAERMAAALRALPSQPRPSEVRIPGLLDGLEVIGGRIDRWLDRPRRRWGRLLSVVGEVG